MDGEIDTKRLERQIAKAQKALNAIRFDVLLGELNCGINTRWVRIPVAYAMFQYLLHEIADDPAQWDDFLREALEECISMSASADLAAAVLAKAKQQ